MWSLEGSFQSCFDWSCGYQAEGSSCMSASSCRTPKVMSCGRAEWHGEGLEAFPAWLVLLWKYLPKGWRAFGEQCPQSTDYYPQVKAKCREKFSLQISPRKNFAYIFFSFHFVLNYVWASFTPLPPTCLTGGLGSWISVLTLIWKHWSNMKRLYLLRFSTYILASKALCPCITNVREITAPHDLEFNICCVRMKWHCIEKHTMTVYIAKTWTLTLRNKQNRMYLDKKKG